MRVMLTGATGFLGGHVLGRLLADDVEVTAVVRSQAAARNLGERGVRSVVGSLEDPLILREALDLPTDAVFHIAADTSTWRGHAERQTRTNVEGTRNVLAAAEAAGVRRFVHTSSVSAFGQQEQTLNETSPRLGKNSWINYERTKAMAEELVLEADARGRIETMVLNPAHILGPGDRHNWASMFLLIDQGKLPGAPPGSGAFADVREVAKAQIAAWHHPQHGEQFLLGGVQASFLELIQAIALELDRKSPVRAMPAGFIRGYARVLDAMSRLTGREPSLTPQAVSFTCHHLKVDSTKAIRELDYQTTPRNVLVHDTCVWLREEGMLKAP
ncbi:MAG TPA: NAD-dependent epimerase/dehydratase family protein [Dokdonella sp.]|uniref:NAD-dependent epimerase/dehydratase family protein n=1 Tax=Dokdonella sp. TaxID=2291710 RepID=UPI002D7E7587|nr:NAD-dependent epimerase/dehydratase family protein [Dokdonella sp.]HET9031645.1 NAD-dependent epimerase/dehydratase family protein [Dokdonella sp.]